MRSRFLPITTAVLTFAATLAAPGCADRPRQTDGAVTRVSAPADDTFEEGRGAKVYEGQIKDARPAWGYLILTIGEGKEAHDVQFDVRGARIVGPSGNELKAQDLRDGDRARIQLTPDGRLVQQISILPDRTPE